MEESDHSKTKKKQKVGWKKKIMKQRDPEKKEKKKEKKLAKKNVRGILGGSC